MSTGVVKTINGEVQLHALVDGKKIIISEASVRRDLKLEDEEDEAVHKELGDSLVRATTTASSLEAEQDNGNITKTRSKATPNESSFLGTTSGGGPRCQETMGDTIAQTRFENVSKLSNDSLLARVKNVVENESHFSLKIVDQDLSSLAMFTKHLMGGSVGSNFGVGEEKIESIGGIGGGSFAKRSMVAKDGLGSVMDSLLMIVVEWLLEKLVELPMCSPMVERMVNREEKKFLD
ncbi:hypothetical protein Tco_0500478 [Tanacetum coccineum]